MSFNFNPAAGETESSSSVDLRRRLAAAMLQQGMDTSPIRSPWQGVARLSEALMGGLAVRRQAQQEQDANNQIMSAITGQPYTPPAQSGGFLSRLFGDNGVPASGAQNQVSATSPSPAAAPSVAANVGSAGISASPDATDLNGYLDDPARRATLPAGMRNNNPGNIKYTSNSAFAGVTGPSSNRDEGDPQAVFATPEAGMQAMYSLLGKKYAGGKTTPNAIIAGNMGWTPGNYQAAANVARYAGIGPDDDIGFGDPQKAQRFMRALMMQEHGKSSGLYPDSMIAAAIGGRAPVAQAPAQVASLDPSAGMASAMPAAQPVVPPPSPTAQPGNMASVTPDQMQAMLGPTPTPGYQDPTVTTAYRQPQATPPAAQAINQQAPVDPTQTASLGPNTGMPAQPAAQSPIPTPSPITPQAASPAQDQSASRAQLAQAMMNAPGMGPTSVANNPRAQALLQAMMNPYASPQVRALAGSVLQTQMQPHTQIVQNPNTGATYLVDTWTGAKQLIDQGQTADSELQKDANGNPIGVFNKRTGEYQKMGDPTAQLDIVTRPDGSIIAVNKITGQQMAAPAGAMKTDSIVEGPVDPQTGYPTKLLYNPVDGVKGVIGPNGQLLPPGSQQAPQQAANAPVPPPGVDPKKYRETMATRAAEAATPSAKDESEFAAGMMARPSYKEYSAAVPTWNSFTQHIQDNTPAADKAIVDDFAKILNPGRAVTTGSFQLNMDAQSVPEYLQGQILKAFTGNGELGPDARAQMAKIAQLKMQEYQKAWNLDAQQGTKIAKSHGLTVENVIPDVPGVDGIDFSKVNSLKTTAAGTGPATATSSTGAPAAASSAMPTATGPNGEKIQWNGSAWVPLSGPNVNPNSNVNRVPTGN
jgi:hypothetical protein